jgi:uncharacterized protein YdiU (UPF0061 family)
MSTIFEPMTGVAGFRFDNSFARELQRFYVPLRPAVVPAPRLLFLNEPLAEELGLDLAPLDSAARAAIFAGNTLPDGAEPLAQAYAGHQFGGFSPQLGDGRALILGEVIDRHGHRRDIAFKGSGRTPFARGGDGKAAVGPMLREVVIGEAMHALGIPTTRALAVAATGEPVYREQILPGAVLTRVAASHIRVGTFQFHAARGDVESVRTLAEYTIARHDSDLVASPHRLPGLLQHVAERQAALIAQWMNVGFIHGVMNTDNMTISGETIDYGPCAFMEAYDPQRCSAPSTTRTLRVRQPARHRTLERCALAETLLPLLSDDPAHAVAMANDVLTASPRGTARTARGTARQLGLHRHEPGDDSADAALADEWLSLLHAGGVDFTLGWRRLADAAAGDEFPLRALFADAPALEEWLVRWRARCASESVSAPRDANVEALERAKAMRSVNPYIIARNHRVEEALAAASDLGDLAPFQRLLAAVTQPYDDAPALAAYAEPAPTEVAASHRTFCGT